VVFTMAEASQVQSVNPCAWRQSSAKPEARADAALRLGADAPGEGFGVDSELAYVTVGHGRPNGPAASSEDL
jgi:hypothetical protein